MLVELGLVDSGRDAVEIGEEVRRDLALLVRALPRLAQQFVDQRLRVYLLLNVERRRMDDEVAPVLLVLAAPDELRVEVGVPRVAHLPGVLLRLVEHRLVFGGRNVPAPGVVVGDRVDVLVRGGLLGHGVILPRPARLRR
ncbi:hypothetical protein [Accumulibacter sp.]|uniref:hypothetical protein n=1 Tax=Accumulibacter sp. TaxID=2053492 RepID=UPI003420772E